MIYKFKENRVWRAYFGGERLDSFAGKKERVRGRRPEEWIASTVTAFNADRPQEHEGISVCENGENFAELIENNPEEMLSKAQSEKFGGKMSILVKLLDAGERLVIQCHPSVPFAKKEFGSQFGKTECWYILDADETANVYLGFKEGISKEYWKSLFDSQNVEGMLDCLHNHKAKKGDLFFVEGGVPHAIGGGCLMVELQEPSDLMVIPERKTPSGVELADIKLHGGLGFEKMWDCFNYDGMSSQEVLKKYYRHIDENEMGIIPVVDEELTQRFSLSLLRFDGEYELSLSGKYAVCVVTDGEFDLKEGNETYRFKKSDNFFIPAFAGKLCFTGKGEIALCFAGNVNNITEKP